MGWWFGRKSAPADVRPFVPAWLRNDAAEEGFARSYETQFDEVYRRNPVGQRAVRLVAGMLGGLTIDGPSTSSGQTAVALVKASGLLEGITASLLLQGNAYVQLIAGADDQPLELCPLRPERVQVVSDERGWPVGYLYRAGARATRINRLDPFGRIQLAHIKALHPRDDHYGMGCIEAAIAAASVHNRASRWNKSLLDQGARPSGALSYEPADGSVMSAEQFKRLKEELASEFSGSGNAGRPMLLEGGLKWQALSLTPADMDFVALKEGAARDIALAFGVPPVLVGLPGDATYANAREAGRALSADDPADGGQDIGRTRRDAERLAGAGEPQRGHRPDQRARGGSSGAVAGGRKRELPQRCGETRDARVQGRKPHPRPLP